MSLRRYLIVQQEKVLTFDNNLFCDTDTLSELQGFVCREFPLGTFAGFEYYVVELNADFALTSEFIALSLRQTLSIVPVEDYPIIAKAHAVLHWDNSYQYCGYCGQNTQTQLGEQFKKACLSCSVDFFPRISPSIIVLIHRDDELVMARAPHYAKGVYGLISGFVEVGETLEDAVHREVQEEIGLKVRNVSYFGSQPWPFPDTLMLGFTAEYASGEINIDENEIIAADWYRYDKLPGRPALEISIASKLIDNFEAARSNFKRPPS